MLWKYLSLLVKMELEIQQDRLENFFMQNLNSSASTL